MRLILTLAFLLLAVPALAQRQITFMPFELPEAGSIVVPVTTGETPSGLAALLDSRTDGAIALAMVEAAFTGEKHQTLTLFGIKPYSRIDLIGIGDGPVDRVAAENYGGLAASLNDGSSGSTVNVLWSEIDRAGDATAAQVAFGYRLGDYRFDRYHEDRLDPATRGDVVILSDDADAESRFTGDLRHLADAVFLARDLSSEPGNVIYPQSFVDRFREAFEGVDDVTIRALDEDDLARLGMGAHLGVGSGSDRPPRLLIIEYLAGDDRPTLALAGKGITFDSGGISLKDGEGMGRMKADMTGAAVVSATVLAAARRGARVNLVALAALAENMPSGSAIRPGDVLTSMSGKTIEINSTDAEGRLVLSDAVYYAQEEYAPDVLIDVATLTGSVSRAVGNDLAGVFSRHDGLAEQLLAAGEASGEKMWRLPLSDTHFEQIKSTVADIINGGISAAGASIGAAFIGSFVAEDQRWAHLDIAGVDFTEVVLPTTPIGYSGWGVRVLDEYLRRHHE
ncbi:MAG: leucyl aminopeptidase [Woeseiaceae bacterium]|nr:leucyl aminopeptidase [Woeseiaceae bacterium]